MPLVGIDLGTASARLAVHGKDGPRLVRFPDGSPDVPSLVTFAPGGVALGRSALSWTFSHAESTFRGMKRRLGSLEGGSGDPLDAEALVALLLQHLLEIVERSTGAWPEGGVVAAPEWFGDAEIAALERASVSAGLSDAQFVAEPMAAALGAVPIEATERRYLVVDVGAGGVGAGVVSMSSGEAVLLSSAADGTVGGDDVDRALVELVVEQLGAQIGLVPCDPATSETLRWLCEQMKRELDAEDEVAYAVEALALPGEAAPTIRLARRQLEPLLSELIHRVEACAMRVLSEPTVRRVGCHGLLLAGGMSRTPAVRACIERRVGLRAADVPLAPGAIALGACALAAAYARAGHAATMSSPDYPPSSVHAPSSVGAPRSGGAPPSVATSAGEAARGGISGRFRMPSDVPGMLRLPMVRPLVAADLDPVVDLPVLLARVLARRDVSGTLHLRGGEKSVELPIAEGRGFLRRVEQHALLQAFTWGEGRYDFVPAPPSTRNRDPYGLLRLAVDGLRTAGRLLDEGDYLTALAPYLDRAPALKPDRHAALGRLGLTQHEQRIVEFSLDGKASAREMLQGGTGRRTAMQLLVVLLLLDHLEWREPAGVLVESTLRDLEERAARLERVNHFEALGVHWSASGEELEDAYQRLLLEVAPGSRAFDDAPELCLRMAERAGVAYHVLRDPVRRVAYRREAYPDLDVGAMTDLLEQRALALSLRAEDKHARHDERRMREIVSELERMQEDAPSPSSRAPRSSSRTLSDPRPAHLEPPGAPDSLRRAAAPSSSGVPGGSPPDAPCPQDALALDDVTLDVSREPPHKERPEEIG